MAKTRTSFKKGEAKGKPKGAVNRTTKEAREFLEFVMFGQLEQMNSALDELYSRDKARYLDACSKLFSYVLPKKTDITSDNKPIPAQLPQIVITTKND